MSKSQGINRTYSEEERLSLLREFKMELTGTGLVGSKSVRVFGFSAYSLLFYCLLPTSLVPVDYVFTAYKLYG